METVVSFTICNSFVFVAGLGSFGGNYTGLTGFNFTGSGLGGNFTGIGSGGTGSGLGGSFSGVEGSLRLIEQYVGSYALKTFGE